MSECLDSLVVMLVLGLGFILGSLIVYFGMDKENKELKEKLDALVSKKEMEGKK